MNKTENKDLANKYDSIYKDGAYENYFTFSFFPAEQLILRMIDNWDNLRVIDIGCGEGRLGAMLSFAGAKSVTGIDFSKEAIKIANKSFNMNNVQFLCADFKDLTEKYDVITMNGVLEHFDRPFEDLKFMLENLLNEGGSIITTSPSFLNPRGYIWMTLQMLLNVPMSLSDLHFLCPFDFEKFCKENNCSLKYISIDQDWGCGTRTILDFRKRLPNALRDANISDENLEKFLKWLEKAVQYGNFNDSSGATIAYKIKRM